MRRALLAAGLLAVVAPAPAGAATVELMVVGKQRVLREAAPVKLASRSLRVARAALRGRRARRRCRCSRARGCACGSRTTGRAVARPRDAGALYVTQIGPDRRRGPAGWVYKVGRRGGDDRRRRSLRPVRHRAAAARRRAAAVVLVRAGPRRGVPAHARGLAGVVDGRAGRAAARHACAATTTTAAACRWRARRVRLGAATATTDASGVAQVVAGDGRRRAADGRACRAWCAPSRGRCGCG